MEERILEAEERLEARQRAASDPAIVSDHEALGQRLGEAEKARAEVEALYARWAALEAKMKG